MYNNGDVGIGFNIQKAPFNDVNFRRAIVYAVDRTKIRETGNSYGSEISGFSIPGMPVNITRDWLLPEVKEKMTNFTYDTSKASDLLEKIGWEKGKDGIWKDKNGKSYNFILGVPNNTAFYFVTSGETLAEQLTKFGLPTKIMVVDPSIYYDNAENKHIYDMSLYWIDVDWGCLLPWWPLNTFFNDQGGFENLPKSKDSQLNLVLPGPDGKNVDVNKTLKNMLYMNSDEMKKAASDLIWISSENALGIAFYQDVTGTWYNMQNTKMKDGWVMQDEIKKYNRNMPLPSNKEDLERIAETNLGFGGQIWPIITGEWMPK